MSRVVRLAEGEELSSNPLFCLFNELRSTPIAVDVAWRNLGVLLLFSPPALAGVPDLGSALLLIRELNG